MAPLCKPSVPKPQHSNTNKKSIGRILITVNVLGSAGPIRFLADGEEPVAVVIQTALKFYKRDRRLPVLGTDYGGFFLYCADVDGALGHLEPIGSHRSRNFLLCKKVGDEGRFGSDSDSDSDRLGRKKSGRWRRWIRHFFSLI